MFTVMTTWKRGRDLVRQKLEASGLPHELLIESLNRRPPIKVPGTAIFMSSSRGRTPVALLHHLKHNKILHEAGGNLTTPARDVYFPHAVRHSGMLA